ncbi:hypothetical protein ALC57_11640, partial [Trachymyrmex cornetzi]
TIEIDHFSILLLDLGVPLKPRCIYNIAKSCVSKKQRALIPVMSVAPNSSNHEKKRYLPPGDTNKSAGLEHEGFHCEWEREIRTCRATGLLQATSLESPQPFSSVHPILLAARCSADLYDSTKLSILSGATFTTPPPPFDVIIPFTLGVHIFPTPDVPTARDNNRTDLVAHRSSTTIRSVLVTRRCDAPTRSLSPRFFPG